MKKVKREFENLKWERNEIVFYLLCCGTDVEDTKYDYREYYNLICWIEENFYNEIEIKRHSFLKSYNYNLDEDVEDRYYDYLAKELETKVTETLNK